MTSAEIAALLTGPVGIAVGAFVRDVWRRRADAADAAAKAQRDADAAKLAANATERSDMVGLLRQQLTAGDERAEKSAARAEAIAAALAENAASTRENSRALDDLRGALTDHSGEELATLREVHAMLRSLTGADGVDSRTSLVPGVRGPTPPRGIPALPAPPPRRVP